MEVFLLSVLIAQAILGRGEEGSGVLLGIFRSSCGCGCGCSDTGTSDRVTFQTHCHFPDTLSTFQALGISHWPRFLTRRIGTFPLVYPDGPAPRYELKFAILLHVSSHVLSTSAQPFKIDCLNVSYELFGDCCLIKISLLLFKQTAPCRANAIPFPKRTCSP
jgi:hypothetical protein